MKKLKDLAVDHDYYCSDNNYYSNDAQQKWDCFADFYEEYKDADIDMNLIFRWDILKKEASDRYSMKIFILHQRKGIYAPHIIASVVEEDVPYIAEILERHYEKLTGLWTPLNDTRTPKQEE